MSPLLNGVKEAGQQALDKRNQPWLIRTEDWFEPPEELRSLFAKVIKADKENIALIPSASYGIAIAARNISLKSGQSIIVLEEQYPSNIYAWRELANQSGAEIITVKRNTGQTWTEAVLEKIDDNTGLIAIPNCHWTDGSIIDLEKVSIAAREQDARLVIDASQSAGAYPIDIDKIKPDFLITVGYKWLLGPYNLGYLYTDQKYLESGKPIEYSWLTKKGCENFTRLVDYQDEFRPGARRFDAGEFPSMIHVPMAIAALTQILKWGVENIQESLAVLTNEIEKMALQHGYEIERSPNRVGHIAGIKLPDNQISALNKRLPENNIFVSFRGNSMRIAPHLHNDVEDIKTVLNFLQE